VLPGNPTRKQPLRGEADPRAGKASLRTALRVRLVSIDDSDAPKHVRSLAGGGLRTPGDPDRYRTRTLC